MVTVGHFLGAQPMIDFWEQHSATQPQRGRDFAEGISDHGGVSAMGVDDGDMAESPGANLACLRQKESAQGIL